MNVIAPSMRNRNENRVSQLLAVMKTGNQSNYGWGGAKENLGIGEIAQRIFSLDAGTIDSSLDQDNVKERSGRCFTRWSVSSPASASSSS